MAEKLNMFLPHYENTPTHVGKIEPIKIQLINLVKHLHTCEEKHLYELSSV